MSLNFRLNCTYQKLSPYFGRIKDWRCLSLLNMALSAIAVYTYEIENTVYHMSKRKWHAKVEVDLPQRLIAQNHNDILESNSEAMVMTSYWLLWRCLHPAKQVGGWHWCSGLGNYTGWFLHQTKPSLSLYSL